MFLSHPPTYILSKEAEAALELDLEPSPGVTLGLKAASSESRLLQVAAVALPKTFWAARSLSEMQTGLVWGLSVPSTDSGREVSWARGWDPTTPERHFSY